MQFKTIFIAVVGILMAISIGVAAQNTGAEKIVIDGGKPGNVSFPHKLHQDNLKDCNVCHGVFPEESGIIAKLKAEGKLKKQQVMNTQCLKCHKDTKNAGQPSGPTACASCHAK